MFEPGIYYDLDENTYHADKDSLSASGAKTLLRAPALFKYERDHPRSSDALDFGSAAHKRVLGVGAEVVAIDVKDKRGNAWSVPAEAARAAGQIPVTAKEAQRIEDMADALASHTLAMELLADGKPEVSAFAVHEPTGVTRRARFDWLRDDGVIPDYKTSACADPIVFERTSVAQFGYHVSAANYTDVARALGIDFKAMAFIVQEKEPPFLVEVVELDRRAIERGRELMVRALERFRDCTESGHWPGYTSNPFTRISVPQWAFYDREFVS